MRAVRQLGHNQFMGFWKKGLCFSARFRASYAGLLHGIHFTFLKRGRPGGSVKSAGISTNLEKITFDDSLIPDYAIEIR